MLLHVLGACLDRRFLSVANSPLGPMNMELATGRFGSDRPALDL
ncbi:hypothetical protein PAHAL_9G424800 [Panicum hallii]|uniref:Uncharacterized protein n=1 Tax=Panicum hallii TaxID=206008 RepID=A0A2S3IPK6_9POAL|nr:hypothetical protein PAHAL_9G424800 [Panicum hallii]